MHELVLRLECKRPEFVKKSLEPDVKNTEDMHTTILSKTDESGAGGDEDRTGRGFVEIRVKGKKLSHLKAIINSYLSIISTLDEIEDIK